MRPLRRSLFFFHGLCEVIRMNHSPHTLAGWAVILLLGGVLWGSCTAGTERATSSAPADSSQSAVDVLSYGPEVPYVPTSMPVVDRMLELAGVTEDDVVYDLGSGDGRIVIRAAERFGARGVGVEIDEALVQEARQNADSVGVADRVTFHHADLFDVDIGEATVVTLYLLPTVNLRLRPKLFEELAPGTRVVSHDFSMDDWEHEERVEVGNSTIYFWTIPEEVPASLQN